MALGTPTPAANNLKGAPSAPTFATNISFAGDDSYPAGGTLAFDAYLAANLGLTPTPIAVISGDCGDHYCAYSPANGGTLKVFVRSTGAEASGDLSAITFNLTVLWK